jgi:hypothetical protein
MGLVAALQTKNAASTAQPALFETFPLKIAVGATIAVPETNVAEPDAAMAVFHVRLLISAMFAINCAR